MQLFKVIEKLRVGLQDARLKKLTVLGQESGIDPVCLGEPAGGLTEAPGKARIDLGERQPFAAMKRSNAYGKDPWVRRRCAPRPLCRSI